MPTLLDRLKHKAKLEITRILQPEGLGEGISPDGKPIFTYNGNMIYSEADVVAFLYSGWRLLFPFLTRRRTGRREGVFVHESASSSEEIKKIPFFSMPSQESDKTISDEQENFIIRFIGLNPAFQSLYYLASLTSPFIYLVRMIIRTFFNFVRVPLEILPSCLSLCCNYFMEKEKERKHLFIESGQPWNKIQQARYITTLFFWDACYFTFIALLAIGRAISSINRGSDFAYHDALRYCLEYRQVNVNENDDLSLSSDQKYKSVNWKVILLANFARFATLLTMLATWLSIFAFLTPIIPVIGPALLPVLSKYLFIEKGFEIGATVFAASTIKYAIASVLLFTASLGYKLIRSFWNVFINSMIAMNSDDSFVKLGKTMAKNSWENILSMLKTNYEKSHANDDDILITKFSNVIGCYTDGGEIRVVSQSRGREASSIAESEEGNQGDYPRGQQPADEVCASPRSLRRKLIEDVEGNIPVNPISSPTASPGYTSEDDDFPKSYYP